MFLLFFHVKGNGTESPSQALGPDWLTLHKGEWKLLLGPVSCFEKLYLESVILVALPAGKGQSWGFSTMCPCWVLTLSFYRSLGWGDGIRLLNLSFCYKLLKSERNRYAGDWRNHLKNRQSMELWAYLPYLHLPCTLCEHNLPLIPLPYLQGAISNDDILFLISTLHWCWFFPMFSVSELCKGQQDMRLALN